MIGFSTSGRASPFPVPSKGGSTYSPKLSDVQSWLGITFLIRSFFEVFRGKMPAVKVALLRGLVNNLCIRFDCGTELPCYYLYSSLKELRWLAVLNRVPLDVSRIIPGNWGKVESGWLVRPL